MDRYYTLFSLTKGRAGLNINSYGKKYNIKAVPKRIKIQNIINK